MLASGSSQDVEEHGTGSKPLQYFALTLHHSIYDGLTMPLILENLEAVYNGAAPLRHRPFQAFVKYIGNRDKTAEVDFWRARFQGLEAAQFPALPSSTYYPRTDSTLMYVVERVGWRRDNITPSTVIRAALALLLTTTTTSADVVFGEVVAGRQVPMPGIDRLAGPTIATVPVRVTVDRQANSTDFLAALQLDAIERVPYEQTGLSRIRQISDEARQACEFQTLLVVQMPEEGVGGVGREGGGSLFAGEVRRRGAEHDARYHGFQTYPLSLICTPDTRTDELHVRVCFDSAVVGREAVARMAQDLELLLRRLCSPDLYGASLGQVTSTREEDLAQIWKWNSEVFPSVDRYVHDLVSETARARPDATAIRGWDGVLTYGVLDHASTRIALRLSEMGIRQGQVVPICSEKTVYAVVALLGVSKAGGAGLMLDTTLPEGHLGRVVKGTNSGALILSSVSKERLASRLGSAVVVVGPDSGLIHDEDTSVGEEQLPTVDPSSCFSIVLTSGSTGPEKHAVVQHRNISSAVFHQRNMLRLDHNSVLFDAAPSHASGGLAAYWGAFHVLTAGGTLCIPSEDEVEKDLEESIGRYGATDIFLTPVAARALDPAKAAATATLRKVYLGGQQVTTHDTVRWIPHVEDVLVVYGVAECAPAAMYSREQHNTTTPLQFSSTIGRGVGVSTWVVDAQDSERLVPIGTVGELCLEGPLVGPGYLHNNNDATADFIESPSWLLKGSPDGSVPGRSGRLFKTGDLVRYEPTSGQVIYVGRTDGQHMLRGQRVDLAQVEHHVRDCIGAGSSEEVVAAEIVVPESIGKPTLVAFIAAAALARSQMSLRDIQVKLQGDMPAHMVPTGYRVVESIPSLASGKTDRRRLREMGTRLSADELAVGPPLGGQPTTDSELRLQQLWSTLLDTPADRILKDSSFVRLGGDSIYAMRLTSLARRKGISLTVQDIMQHPQLSEMASAMTLLPSSGQPLTVRPFSLLRLPSKKAAAIDHVARQCAVDASQVQDIFPCTSVQKSLLSMTARSAGSYVARYSLRLRPDIDLARIKKAWGDASRVAAPILRYRIVDVPDEGLVQVQIDEPPQWDEYDDIDTWLKCEDGQSMGLDTPLTRLAVVREREEEVSSDETQKSSWRCYITQHHAIYDGYSVGLLLEEVSKAYAGVVDDDVAPAATFQAFIQHNLNVKRDDALDFWRQQFAGCEAAPFPALPSQDYRPKADSTIRRNMADLEWQSHASKSAVIRAAWAVLVAHYTRSDDVLLGAMVSGRQVPLAGVDRTIAPLISAVPLRIRVDPKESVDKLLQDIQGQSIAMTAYEQTELLDIRRVSAEADVGTRFNMLLVVNPPEERNGDVMQQGPFLQHQPMGDVSNRNGELDDFNPNAVMIMCHLGAANVGLGLDISFDSHVVPAEQMERMAAQFEHVLRQLNDTSALQRPVEDISAVSKQDIAQLWAWNSPLPEATARCVHDLIGDTMQRQPQAPAICAWDGNLSYSELDTLSARLARHLESLSMGPGSIVPLCFEKSMWYTVAALGVMRAGAACVAMDSTQPESRLRSIVQQVLPRFILASASNQDLAQRLSSDALVVVVSHNLTTDQYVQQQGPTTRNLPAVLPSDVLYGSSCPSPFLFSTSGPVLPS
jgi:non-ribosomal peptide synthetase component F/aryl carrier-like protein